MLIVLVLFGGLIVLSQGSAVASIFIQYFKVTSILGILYFISDSAASIIIDGKILAAAQEERFTRKNTIKAYPYNAIEFVLKYSKLKLSQLTILFFM